jgi:trk system potassium uptake protein TrkH
MGIIVLGIAILPKLAVGGMELLGAEAPGPITEKLTPRIAQTAKALWGIYTLLTLLEALALMALGVGPLEAVNHAMATMATGGFSTRNASVAGFDSGAIEMVVLFFMLMAGANFALHFHLLRGRPQPLLRDREFRMFLGILGTATLLLTVDLVLAGKAGILDALRLSSFQSATMVTTTGFATADFDAWPHFSRALLFLLMFVGGCAGSTGGSVKVVRIMIVLKKLVIDLRRLVRPHAVLPVRVGTRAIPDEVVTSVTTFFILFLTLFAVGGLVLSILGIDLVTAFSASAACLGNIGPGFASVGPTLTYAPLPAVAKLFLVGLMIVGRLELYTVLVLLFVGLGGRRH